MPHLEKGVHPLRQERTQGKRNSNPPPAKHRRRWSKSWHSYNQSLKNSCGILRHHNTLRQREGTASLAQPPHRVRCPVIIGKAACAGEALRTQRERWLPNPRLQHRSRTGRRSQKGCTTTEGNLQQFMLCKNAGKEGTVTEESPSRGSTNVYPAQCRMKEGRTKTLLKAKSENLRCTKDTANPTDKRMPHPHRITMHPHWKNHTMQTHHGVRNAAKRSQSQPPQAKP